MNHNCVAAKYLQYLSLSSIGCQHRSLSPNERFQTLLTLIGNAGLKNVAYVAGNDNVSHVAFIRCNACTFGNSLDNMNLTDDSSIFRKSVHPMIEAPDV